jgi:prepilin-type N-terminal cleavage/methylation domain-containing protein
MRDINNPNRTVPVSHPKSIRPCLFGVPQDAFTLVELLAVIAVIAILAGLILPALAASKAKAQGGVCQNNNKQLVTGWLMYADDHAQGLPYNMAGADTRTNLNWAEGVLDWELTPDNTNLSYLTSGSIGAYVAQSTAIYHCPADKAVSSLQGSSGWNMRVRSYSMNASVGDAGELSASGVNTNNPGYAQFFKLTTMPAPARIFVFLDEHPDSITDGYFVNHSSYPEWNRLPASWHAGAAALSFGDGHAELHAWKCPTTTPPSAPDAASLPIDASDDPRDFNWVIAHMSVALSPYSTGW